MTTPHPKVRAYALGKVAERTSRLVALIESRAPDSQIAVAAAAVGRAGRMLDPHYLARVDAAIDEERVRRIVGVCIQPGCPSDAVRSPLNDGLCAPHLAEVERAEIHAAHPNAGGDDEPS